MNFAFYGHNKMYIVSLTVGGQYESIAHWGGIKMVRQMALSNGSLNEEDIDTKLKVDGQSNEFRREYYDMSTYKVDGAFRMVINNFFGHRD